MINKVSQITKDAIKRKSAYALPDRPSERGMKPDEIKKAFWQPVVDTAYSALAEIDRVVDEVNQVLPKHCTVDISIDKWTNKTVSLSADDNAVLKAITPESSVQVIFDDDSAATVVNCGVEATAVGDGTITLTCATTPTAAVSATIIIMN